MSKMLLSERIKSYFELSKSADEGLSSQHENANNRCLAFMYAGQAKRAEDFLATRFIKDISELEAKAQELEDTISMYDQGEFLRERDTNQLKAKVKELEDGVERLRTENLEIEKQRLELERLLRKSKKQIQSERIRQEIDDKWKAQQGGWL